MSETYIEVVGSDGQTKHRVKASEYLKGKKMRI